MNITRIELRECVELPAAEWTPENPRTYVLPVDEVSAKDLVGRNTFWTAYWPYPTAPHLPMAQIDGSSVQNLCSILAHHFARAGTEMRPFKENDE